MGRWRRRRSTRPVNRSISRNALDRVCGGCYNCQKLLNRRKKSYTVESEKKHFDLAKFVADHQIPIKDKPRQDQDLVHTEDHGHNSPLSTVHSLTPQPPNLQDDNEALLCDCCGKTFIGETRLLSHKNPFGHIKKVGYRKKYRKNARKKADLSKVSQSIEATPPSPSTGTTPPSPSTVSTTPEGYREIVRCTKQLDTRVRTLRNTNQNKTMENHEEM